MFCGDDWLVCSTSSHVACGSCACDLVGGKKKTDYKTSCIHVEFLNGGCESLVFLFLIGYIILSYFNAFFWSFLESWAGFLHQTIRLMISSLFKACKILKKFIFPHVLFSILSFDLTT